MTSVLRRPGHDDAELARRVSAGDGAAFAVLDGRHRGALTRYAGSLLRRSEHDAEDVVQDALIRAHDVLRAGDVPEELRPWLYRLVRNRAIDEVRRKRWGEEALDDAHLGAGDSREEPDTVLSRKETLRRLVEDLADLPLRHVKGCDACRAYQGDIRRLSKQLRALNPALGLPIWPPSPSSSAAAEPRPPRVPRSRSRSSRPAGS